MSVLFSDHIELCLDRCIFPYASSDDSHRILNGRKPDNRILDEYKLNLFENSYEKIWEELSAGERDVVRAIATHEPESDVKLIRESIPMDSNMFSTYKDTLHKCGLISKGTAYGRVEFCLPFFAEYVLSK